MSQVKLLKTIAADFGISESCLTGWRKSADVVDGTKLGTTTADNAELREARKRIRLLEQEKRGPGPCRGVSVAGEPAGK